MADWHGIKGKKGSVGVYSRRSMIDEDFEEADVWSAVKESEDSSPKYYSPTSSSSAWHHPSAPRMIPRANTSNPPPPTTRSQEAKVVQQSSAPVNIPDWSKIYGKNAKMGSWTDDGIVYDEGNGNHHNDDDNDDDDDDMVPPHEWIARKLARSQISSFSVCEGIGRTLKGRDLSKVRNAILTKTGFLE